ncbi:unnamed protein product, partial [Amoebophrya sp. A25]|eukprot:GSA25T00004631001.1
MQVVTEEEEAELLSLCPGFARQLLGVKVVSNYPRPLHLDSFPKSGAHLLQTIHHETGRVTDTYAESKAKLQEEMDMLESASDERILRRWWMWVQSQTSDIAVLKTLWDEYTAKYPRGEVMQQISFTGTSPGQTQDQNPTGGQIRSSWLSNNDERRTRQPEDGQGLSPPQRMRRSTNGQRSAISAGRGQSQRVTFESSAPSGPTGDVEMTSPLRDRTEQNHDPLGPVRLGTPGRTPTVVVDLVTPARTNARTPGRLVTDTTEEEDFMLPPPRVAQQVTRTGQEAEPVGVNQPSADAAAPQPTGNGETTHNISLKRDSAESWEQTAE